MTDWRFTQNLLYQWEGNPEAPVDLRPGTTIQTVVVPPGSRCPPVHSTPEGVSSVDPSGSSAFTQGGVKSEGMESDVQDTKSPGDSTFPDDQFKALDVHPVKMHLLAQFICGSMATQWLPIAAQLGPTVSEKAHSDIGKRLWSDNVKMTRVLNAWVDSGDNVCWSNILSAFHKVGIGWLAQEMLKLLPDLLASQAKPSLSTVTRYDGIPVSLELVTDFVQRMCGEWYRIASYFGGRTATEAHERIYLDPSPASTKMSKVIAVWIDSVDGDVRWSVLTNALRTVGLRGVANSIEQILDEQLSQLDSDGRGATAKEEDEEERSDSGPVKTKPVSHSHDSDSSSFPSSSASSTPTVSSDDAQKYIHMPLEQKREKYKCGMGYKTLNEIPTWRRDRSRKDFVSRESSHLSDPENVLQPVSDLEIAEKISLWRGDITTLEVDAIVNSIDTPRYVGGAVNRCIHSAAGWRLGREFHCSALQGEWHVGYAMRTAGYDLPARHVIHACTVIGENGSGTRCFNPEEVTQCYENSLAIVLQEKLRSVAFPCLGTGVLGLPNVQQAKISLETVCKWLAHHKDKVDRIIFCVFQEIDLQIYTELLTQYLPIKVLNADAWKTAYEEALEKQGSVSVEVTRCLFIGPPGVGKSSLKHLLVHNKSKAVQISTPVMEAPNVVRITPEHYALEQGSSSWQLMEGEAIRQSVQLSALRNEYKFKARQPSQNISNPGEPPINASESTSSPSGLKMKLKKIFLSLLNRIGSGHDSVPSGTTEDHTIQQCQSKHPLSQSQAELENILSQFLSCTESLENGVILNDASFLHLLDSGGQHCFLDVLPLLLLVPCSYVLVFNASQDQDQPYPVTYRPQAPGSHSTLSLPGSQNRSGWHLIQRMLSSFHTMGFKQSREMQHFQTSGTQSPQPSIHLIGTFKDVLQRENRLDKQSKSLNKGFQLMLPYPSFRNIVKPDRGTSVDSSVFYLVNNNMTEEELCSPAEFRYIQQLRSSLSQSKAALRMNVPLMWYLLQQIVSKTDRKLFLYSELMEFSLRKGLVTSEEHFCSFIKLFHMLGFFIFFESSKSSKETALVCTSSSFFFKEASKVLSIQFTEVHSQESHHFKSTGILGPSTHLVFEDLNISKEMDHDWLLGALVHTGIAAKIEGNCQKLFIPAALPCREAQSTPASVAALCAAFRIQEDPFSVEYITLFQGVFCKLAVEIACNPQCRFVPKESFRSSIKFYCGNSHIVLTERTNMFELAVHFEESFASCHSGPSGLLKQAHLCCSNVLKMIKTVIAKVSEDMFGPSSVDVGEVVVGFKCTCGADLPHMAVVDEENLSLRCIGGKNDSRLQKLSLSQLVWFKPLLDTQAQIILQGSGQSKHYALQELSAVPPPCPPCLDQNLDDALVALLPDMRTCLSLVDLLPRLERPAGGFMSKTEKIEVEEQTSSLHKVDKIVGILRTKSSKDFHLFLSILDGSGNEHWAETLRIRSKISFDTHNEL